MLIGRMMLVQGDLGSLRCYFTEGIVLIHLNPHYSQGEVPGDEFA